MGRFRNSPGKKPTVTQDTITQRDSSRSLPGSLAIGAVVVLGLIAVLTLAGCEGANRLGLFAQPTKTALIVMHITYTPLPTVIPATSQPLTAVPPSPIPESQQLDPCSPLVITQDEAQAILAEPVTPVPGAAGGCAFNNASSGLYTVSASAAQGEQTANIMMGQATLLNLAGIQFDAAQTDAIKTLASPATTKEFFAELVRMAREAPSVKARLIDGIAEGAYWGWLSGGSRPEGVLVVWRGGNLVNVNAVVPNSRQEQEILMMSESLAVKMLNRLPARFTIGQPQGVKLSPTATLAPVPTLTAIPPPTVTGVPPTLTPRPSLTHRPPATTEAPQKPGVYTLALRSVPPQPQNGQGVLFVVTFLNTTGSEQYFRWCVESFRADGKSHGITSCRPARTIAVGRTDLSTTDPYVAQKFGPCLPLRARVIWEDSEKRRIPFTLPGGSDLWLPYQFCPA